MAGRSPARFLAPLALVAFAVALLIVISNGSGSGSGSPSSVAPERSSSPAKGSGSHKKKHAHRHRTYTVKNGDTPSGIAEKTGIPLSTLLRLNPNLDPQTLNPGEKIKLRR